MPKEFSMKRKGHGPEGVIRKLREAEALEASGQTAGQVCQKLEVSPATLSRWRKQYRRMGDDLLRRYKALEEENRRLKKAVANLTLDKQILEEAIEGKD